jgi:ribosomal protein L5
MNIISQHIVSVVNYDFLLKYNCKTLKILPKLEKIVLSAKFSESGNINISILVSVFTFLKPYITLGKKNNVNLYLRKGEPVGIKITLRRKSIINFLLYFLIEILPSDKKLVPFKVCKDSFHYQIKNIFNFTDLNEFYTHMSDIKTLDIVIIGKNLNPNFYRSLRFPIK